MFCTTPPRSSLAPLRFAFCFSAPLVLAACADVSDDLTTVADELRAATKIESASGAQVLARSADGRRIAYGIGCDSESATLRLRDGRTGRSVTMATGVACMPGSVSFSNDGGLVAFGNGQGVISVYDVAHKTTKTVSRAGASGIGVLFSPDSSWLVVASMGDAGVALDAWDMDLGTSHEIASGVFFSPFPGGPNDNVRFSPDGQKLLYVGGLNGPMPVGDLMLFDRGARTSKVLAHGVPAPTVLPRRDFQHVAFVRGVTLDPNAPPSPFVAGELADLDLTTGNIATIEANVAATPVTWAACNALVYVIDGAMGAPATLKAAAGGNVKTLDAAVFRGFGPTPSIVPTARGDALAWVGNVDPARFDGDLQVASLSRCSEDGLVQTKAASHVVPMTPAWANDDTLVYLHDATSTMPGAASGTLAAWRKSSRTATDLASQVTQLGLVVEPSGAVRYVADYDAGNAMGELTTWSPSTNTTRVLGRNAAVMSIQTSPDGGSYGFVSVTPDPAQQNPPTTTLMVARAKGRSAPTKVADDVTTFALGANGQIVYAKADGVYRVVR